MGAYSAHETVLEEEKDKLRKTNLTANKNFFGENRERNAFDASEGALDWWLFTEIYKEAIKQFEFSILLEDEARYIVRSLFSRPDADSFVMNTPVFFIDNFLLLEKFCLDLEIVQELIAYGRNLRDTPYDREKEAIADYSRLLDTFTGHLMMCGDKSLIRAMNQVYIATLGVKQLDLCRFHAVKLHRLLTTLTENGTKTSHIYEDVLRLLEEQLAKFKK